MRPILVAPALCLLVMGPGCSPSPAAAGTPADASSDGAAMDASGDGPVADAGSDAEDAALLPIHVTVDRSAPSGRLLPGAAGLSYEKAHMEDGFLNASNAPLVALLKLLGPSILRIGANTVDETTWTADGGGGTSGQIAKPDVDAFASLVKAAGWTAIYGVNLKTSNPSAAADEAAYAAGALGSSLYGFEIGNEPDLYTSTALVSNWSYAGFKSEWESFEAAMHAAAPDASFSGPATAFDYDDFTDPFASDEAADIDLLTQHYYRDNALLPTATIQELLSNDSSLSAMLTAVSQAATKAGTANGYRLAETNSFYNSGREGVSNSYASALWAIDFLFTIVQHGCAGANFHGGNTPGWYTPIADADGSVTEVRPEYYGMLFFSRAGTGNLYAATLSPSTSSFHAFAVGGADGSSHVALVNQDATTTVRVALDLGTPATSAGVLRLTGPGLAATSGVLLGGAAVGADGTWTPDPATPLLVSGSTVTLDVPPASAALVAAQ